MDVSYTWYDSLVSDKKGKLQKRNTHLFYFLTDHFFVNYYLVISNCIQHEKAAIIFNAGAIYSQLATAQHFRSVEGKKRAADYFKVSDVKELYN